MCKGRKSVAAGSQSGRPAIDDRKVAQRIGSDFERRRTRDVKDSELIVARHEGILVCQCSDTSRQPADGASHVGIRKIDEIERTLRWEAWRCVLSGDRAACCWRDIDHAAVVFERNEDGRVGVKIIPRQQPERKRLGVDHGRRCEPAGQLNAVVVGAFRPEIVDHAFKNLDRRNRESVHRAARSDPRTRESSGRKHSTVRGDKGCTRTVRKRGIDDDSGVVTRIDNGNAGARRHIDEIRLRVDIDRVCRQWYLAEDSRRLWNREIDHNEPGLPVREVDNIASNRCFPRVEGVNGAHDNWRHGISKVDDGDAGFALAHDRVASGDRHGPHIERWQRRP